MGLYLPSNLLMDSKKRYVTFQGQCCVYSDPGFEKTTGAPLPVQNPDGRFEYEVEKIVPFRLYRG